MAEKKLNNIRIINKHDTEANWIKATGFTPKQGELIVYDIDDNYDYERIKIGDGVQNVNALPFYAGSWENLADRPFGDETINPIAWNGIVGDSATFERDGFTFVKVSDRVLTKSNFVNGATFIFSDGNNTDITDMYVLDEGTGIHVFMYAYSFEESCEIDGITIPEAGTYFALGSTGYHVQTLAFPSIIKTIDEKYIPDTIALVSDIDEVKGLVGDTSVADQIANAVANNQSDWSVNDETSPVYVKNRTHWVSVEHKAWINNETLLFENFNGAYTNRIALDEQILSVGHTYDIVIDDESYNCVAYEFEGMVCLGNLSIMDSSLTNTNESFFIYSSLNDGIGGADESFIVVATSLDGDSHTITLAADVTTYHKIDENYLPHIVGRPGERIGSEIFNDYNNNFAGGAYAHAEGYSTLASGYASHAEGELTKATFENAHAEGNETTASGSNSHAEGNKTTASNYNAHAEGSETVASGHSSHAEGLRTEASGQGSHAEGSSTKASAWNSHSEGQGTEAAGRSQHVFGEYNIVDKSTSGISQRSKYIQIAGNGGSENAKSNAYTLDWSGNAWFKGAVKIGGTGQDDDVAKELATQEYVDGSVATAISTLIGDIKVSDQINTAIAAIKPKCTTITLAAANWTSDTNPWSQVAAVNGVTANSKVDLQPTAVQIVEMQNNDIALIAENNDGVVTVYAIGSKPTKDYTMQALITEVAVV